MRQSRRTRKFGEVFVETGIKVAAAGVLATVGHYGLGFGWGLAIVVGFAIAFGVGFIYVNVAE